MQTPSPSARPHVVIIGCGFGGLEAARKLQRADVDVTVIDKTNHHLFQPLLYQVATAGLAAPSIAAPVRALFRKQANVTTLLAEVTGIDPAARTVQLADGSQVAYDHLIVAAGATHSYFGHDEWAPAAPGLKTLADAFEIRRRVLMSFETAETTADPERRRALLTFVVIGAGPTGVEMAGTLAEIAKHTLAGEFRRIDPGSAQVLLVEGGPRVLQAMPESLSQKALEQLERLGVEVRLNARVTAIDNAGLEVQTGGGPDGAPLQSYRIPSSCVVWAAGVAASPLGRLLGNATGVECDRAGRIKVEPDLSLAGHPEISVVGDLAAAMSHAPGKPPKPVPGVSPGAKQAGRAAAANILRRLAGQPTVPFRYADYGNLATIGRNSAVVDLGTPFGPLRFSGRPAWLFWLFAHAYFLIGFRNRVVVMWDWASAYWSFQRNARVVADVQGRSES
ncbi:MULTISPECIES: NAD(P)/FAD-dependent oxidoreductase [Variovorax]|uniref:NADH:ubiquinone reductase (non-electrogenic) n=1 Tax=Variovorax boronicumulans TaxID=436515 RepID=A0AAW8E1U2_9BURK|nr:NAD(P)/FAD-dependent oxidoreductase [Variovorax boronicumulans]MDP9880464.1 NADH dehydrogenase [Variovorax boronicumulans]MDP9918705.1 NADH dehydrogenase [Variovorax boronicumulans]MDP9925750.1 NADH dehydrogenase [Variovorax boronicumulans]GER09729.1 NAD(P)/FAD-dependent oxidoreductase [Variovorax boronicumulans]